MPRLDLIKFTHLNGQQVNKFGLQEVGEDGKLLNLYDDEADQLTNFPQAKFEFVRTLGNIEDSDDFWQLVAEAPEITPAD